MATSRRQFYLSPRDAFLLRRITSIDDARPTPGSGGQAPATAEKLLVTGLQRLNSMLSQTDLGRASQACSRLEAVRAHSAARQSAAFPGRDVV